VKATFKAVFLIVTPKTNKQSNLNRSKQTGSPEHISYNQFIIHSIQCKFIFIIMMAVTTLTTSFLPAKPFPSRQFRLYKRRRLKIKASFPVPPPSPFENLFNTLISQCSSVNSIDFIAPSLGFASGAALFFSRFKSHQNSDVGEWILFASPTPFNRFVLLRCPSISFKEIRYDVNERLMKDEKHYGRIRVKKRDKDLELDLEEELRYQRVCLSASDGGVVSLDWPVELDLEEERGLDSTLLIVPGTPQGSMDDNIRVFVIDALKRGFFPVVMNPRGCASSPITTPRYYYYFSIFILFLYF